MAPTDESSKLSKWMESREKRRRTSKDWGLNLGFLFTNNRSQFYSWKNIKKKKEYVSILYIMWIHFQLYPKKQIYFGLAFSMSLLYPSTNFVITMFITDDIVKKYKNLLYFVDVVEIDRCDLLSLLL